MAKDDSVAVKDAIHKLQLFLLEGIQDEKQLLGAGSLMSQNDYQEVVTERTIANMCGYPLCSNPLPEERPSKGHYRISLKEHKVYDLRETYLYCSTSCVVNSRAFAGSLPDERLSVLNPKKVNEVMELFKGLSFDSKEDLGKNGNLGLSELKIQEKTDVKSGEVSFEEWICAADAIEGYTPQRGHRSHPQHSKSEKEGSKSKSTHTQLKKENRITFNDIDFMSSIITQDEYSISKSPDPTGKRSKDLKGKSHHKDVKDPSEKMPVSTIGSPSRNNSQVTDTLNGEVVNVEDLSISTLSLASSLEESHHAIKGGGGSQDVKDSELKATMLKSSLKSSDPKKLTRSVTWADEITDDDGCKNLCEHRESNNNEKRAAVRSGTIPLEGDYDSDRFSSAEACAKALSIAAEAVISGESDECDAVSKAGLIVLPPPQKTDDSTPEENDDGVLNPDQVPLRWPKKPGSPNYDLFDSEDSWYDAPPEGFSLSLSPFSTVFMSLFAWMSSSSLAYIYGRDESFHEEYLSVNGREYPRKVVLADGRSSEIKETLAGCLARALPGLITDLRLPTPVSILEQGMARFLDTMSFIDPLPSLRMKQWQVIVLLFLDALSVSRIPPLAPYMTGRRVLLSKVLEGAQISAEEYEIMKDLLIPLGRVPQFSSQSGG